ncbi:cytochrome b/b6 domain-containing protein [bacterium]|nr:cytochrome b/b6 domain-containing protein [bacterium]MBU1434237.1 cytochrome b/b6 domain-containing protein [bacterium]MBU1504332.1 cytochrome b/b6 domain-containing protein [bacterium]
MKYSSGFKIWHWLNAIIILGLLGTVFLRKTFLSYRENAEILLQKLAEIGVTVTLEQAKVLAKAIREPMWEWHIYLGYALAFLVIYRIVLYFQGAAKKEKFATLSLHKKGVESLYYILYASLFFMSITGLVMEFHELFGISKELSHDIKELHELVFNVILVFVPLHIAGVIIAENREDKGIISELLHCEKKE